MFRVAVVAVTVMASPDVCVVAGFLWRNVFKSKFGWRRACLLSQRDLREKLILLKNMFLGFNKKKASKACLVGDLPQMIASHEFLHAHRAREILLAGVRSCVTRQFIGSGEPFATIEPLAWKWPFPSVRTQMSLQM